MSLSNLQLIWFSIYIIIKTYILAFLYYQVEPSPAFESMSPKITLLAQEITSQVRNVFKIYIRKHYKWITDQ